MEGEKKNINTTLWLECAGPLVTLPIVGSHVVYFPQGHSEQVVASTQTPKDGSGGDIEIPNYPNLPSHLVCQLHNVTLHADQETDEVYAQMTLQPVQHHEKDVTPYMTHDLGIQTKQPTLSFCKTLTASDTSTHGGFSIPRRAAEKVFPPLDFTKTPPAQELVARDLHNNEWHFRHIYRGQPRRHLLTTGWSVFVSAKRLQAGDTVLFMRDESNQLLLGIRRANRQQANVPSSLLSSDSMLIGVLAAAAHAASTNSRFTIYYNPRASTSEFVIPLCRFSKATYHPRVSVGMRFRMELETEDSSTRRYMGTITGIGDLDSVRWPNSLWRTLKVGWDESTAGQRQKRVSLWEIEPLTAPYFPCSSSIFMRAKRPRLDDVITGEIDDISRLQIWARGEEGKMDMRALNAAGINIDHWLRLQQKPEINSGGAPQPEYYRAMAAQALQEFRTMDTPKQPQAMQGPPVIQMPQQHAQQYRQSPYPPAQQQQQMHQHQLQHQQNQQLHQQQNHQALRNQTAQPEYYQQTQTQAHQQQPEYYQPKQTQTHQPTQQQHSFQQLQFQHQNHQQNLQENRHQNHQQQNRQQQSPQMHQHQHQHQQQQQQQQQQQSQSGSQGADVQYMPPSSRIPTGFGETDVGGFPATNSLSLQSLLNRPADTLVPDPTSNHAQYQNVTNLRPNQLPMQQLAPPGLLQQEPQLSGSWMSSIRDSNVLSPRAVEASTANNPFILPRVDAATQAGLGPLSIPQAPTYPYSAQEQDSVQSDPRSHLLFGVNIDSNIITPGGISAAATSLDKSKDGMTACSPSGSDMHVSGGVPLEDSPTSWQQQQQQQQVQPVRTFTKVYKTGSVGRSIDVTRLKNYDELRREIARMFGLDSLLGDPSRSNWQLVFVDNERDVLLVGDDPWEEFVTCVRFIKILSPSEVTQMSREGIEGLSVLPSQRQTSSSSDDCAMQQETNINNFAAQDPRTMAYRQDF